jgi:hypothetical protein
MDSIFDIYLLEAVLNGLLLGGLLALLALGLNLIFGVIDVVWICYAELVMVGMYTIWWLHVQQGWPVLAACAAGVVVLAALGMALHHFIVRPVLAAEPINQLLVTGGVLFFLQAAATVVFGVEFRNLGVRLPGVSIGDMNFSLARLIAFLVALAAIGEPAASPGRAAALAATLRDHPVPAAAAAAIAAAAQDAIIAALVSRVDRALAATPGASLVVGGGVAANVPLREALGALAEKRHLIPGADLLFAPAGVHGEGEAQDGRAAGRDLRGIFAES